MPRIGGGQIGSGGGTSPGGGGTTTIAAPSLANTVALLGTSITDANKPYDQGGGAMALRGDGYFFWAQAMLRQAPALTIEAGVSGDTTSGMLARIGDVLTSGARMCVVETGPNDVHGGSTAFDINARLSSIYDQLRAAGMLILGCHINPTTTIVASPAMLAVMHGVNRWISAYARTHAGIAVVPWAAAMSEPATGAPLTGTLHDGTHPNTYGAAVMGAVLATTLEQYVVAVEDLPTSNADPTNLIGNGLLTGGTTLATGWTANAGTATYTASKMPRTDGDPGEWQQIAVTTGNVELYSPIGTTGYAAGDVLEAVIEVDGDLTNATRADIQCWAVDGSGFPVAGGASLGLADYYTSTKRVPLSRAVMRSHPLTVPAGVAGVRLDFNIAGNATVRVSRAAVHKVVTA